jgi:hypothetical protein
MEYYSMWAGQGAGMSRAIPAAELVGKLVEETARIHPSPRHGGRKL